jgi:hypothetical protein
LKGVFGFVRVAQQAAAGAEDHRRVPPDEEFESGLVPVADEPVEQIPVRYSGVSGRDGPAQKADPVSQRGGGHARSSDKVAGYYH